MTGNVFLNGKHWQYIFGGNELK